MALGDSYSSRTGTRTYFEPTCQRSAYAYPCLLHNAHPEWTFVDAACSGAKTGDIINTQSYIQNTLPGRLDLVNNTIKSRSPSAKVVVIDYPKLFNGTDCNALTFFSSGEMTRALESDAPLPQRAGRSRTSRHHHDRTGSGVDEAGGG